VLLMPNRPELVESLWAAFHGGRPGDRRARRSPTATSPR
jgi:hypothetical protein